MARLTHVFQNEAHQALFTMRVVGAGDRYGKDMRLTYAPRLEEGQQPGPEALLVEFYDLRWKFDHEVLEDGTKGPALGQFVSRYYLNTLLEKDSSGLSAFDRGLLLDGGTGLKISEFGMRDCFLALQAGGILPSDPEDVFAERVQLLTDRLNSVIESQQTYFETHKDAGDAYRHLPGEGDWAYHNGDQRLDTYMRMEEIDPKNMEIDVLSDRILEDFRMTYLETGDDHFVVGEFPVGEIEIQVDFEAIDPNATESEWEAAKAASDAVFKGNLAYVLSDAIWSAVISKQDIEDLISQYHGKTHEDDDPEI
jgi:hypothetical protein